MKKMLSEKFKGNNQMYYWSTEWQVNERKARKAISLGKVTVLKGVTAVDTYFSEIAKRRQGG